jgi:hypothetical protein
VKIQVFWAVAQLTGHNIPESLNLLLASYFALRVRNFIMLYLFHCGIFIYSRVLEGHCVTALLNVHTVD